MLRTWLRTVATADRMRLAALQWLHPGLEVHPSASTALAVARFQLAPGARLRIGPHVSADRRKGAVTFFIEPGAEVVLEEGAWLRTEIGPIHICAFEGASIRLGPDSLLNGCHLSAKQSLVLGRRAWVGPGSRVFDSDQHDFDADHPEKRAPVVIGDYAWVASDATVLKGVRVGEHAVVGARSLVTSDVPPHTVVFGSPATPRGTVGDRSTVR